MKFLVGVLIAAIYCLFSGQVLYATGQPSWTSSEPYVFLNDSNIKGCNSTAINFMQYDDVPPKPYGWGCVIKVGDAEFVSGSYRLNEDSPIRWGVFAIKSEKTDDKYLPLHISDDTDYVIAENGAGVIEISKQDDGSSKFYTYSDVDSATYIVKSIGGNPIEVRFDQTSKSSNNFSYPLSSAALSDNGKYIVAKHYDIEGYRGWINIINTSNGSNITKKIEGVYDEVKAISNTGRYVLVGNEMYDTQDCWESEQIAVSECRHVSLSGSLSRRLANYTVEGFSNMRFSDDDQRMYGILEVIGAGKELIEQKDATISFYQQLEYLGLGDSYTSGEGDIGTDDSGNNYYTSSTKSGCHLSLRSYPYLLIEKWQLNSAYSQSVACSGALINMDYTSNVNTYKGQRSELVGGNREDKIKSSLINFSPGFVPQLEFVKRYQPKIITITGSGNDVGFANIIEYCAGDAEALVLPYSCEYIEGGLLNELLNDAIDSQYKNVKKLIEDMQDASPNSKIYYIGYPSFIGGSDTDCDFNNGILEGNERDMINKSVTRLNGVIKRAADATGVKYVDIESSLNGGRLCEGSKYVTGLWDVGIVNITKPELTRQAFHPNAKGHDNIAKTIKSKIGNPISESKVARQPVASIDPGVQTYQVRMVENSQIDEQGMITVNLQAGSTQGGTVIYMTGFSSPVNLGSYISMDDGSLSTDVKLPESMKAGKHLLLLDITVPSGEKTRLFQYFTITKRSIAGNDKNISSSIVPSLDNAAIDSKKQSEPNNVETNIVQTNISKKVTNRKIDFSDHSSNSEPKGAQDNNSIFIIVAIILLITGGFWFYVKKN